MPNFFPCRYFPSFIPKSVNNGIPHTALDTHFNPRTRERCNPGTSTLTAASAHFNPYTPRMVRRKRGNTLMIPTLFQSTHPRGVRRNGPRCKVLLQRISIHAPHAGCDIPIFRVAFLITISIHAPHAGCDAGNTSVVVTDPTFQSTHPMRGATSTAHRRSLKKSYFNPRTPCGVRPYMKGDRVTYGGFQSTHPMRGATTPDDSPLVNIQLFQSTHPMRGAT